MIWSKRQLAYAKFAPYQDRLEKLMMPNAARYQEFIMVSVDTDNVGVSTYYIGVPEKAYLSAFDGFEVVAEEQLPKQVDTVLIADGTSDEFTSRFQSRSR
jgi:hypothetical protein